VLSPDGTILCFGAVGTQHPTNFYLSSPKKTTKLFDKD